MSTPPFLRLPAGARATRRNGKLGALVAVELVAVELAAGSGTVVLVPGFTGSKEDFIAVLEPLAARGWNVLTYDQRGQYESFGVDDESAYDLDGFADDLDLVVDDVAAAGPVHVVGHSFGGVVAGHAVLRRGGRGIASLTLMCSGTGPIPEHQHAALGLLAGQLPATDLGTLYDLVLAYVGRAPGPADVEGFLRERYLRNNPHGLRRIALHLVDTPDRIGDLAALAATGFPVQVMYGEHDDAWTLEGQDAVAAACGTAPIVIRGAGHSPAVDSPGATAVALDEALRPVGAPATR